MGREKLLKKLSKLGLPMFQVEDYFDVNEALAEVVESKDLRLWEGFPLLLLNAYKMDKFSLPKVRGFLKSLSSYECFQNLFSLSLAFYKYLNLGLYWVDQFYKNAEDSNKEMMFNFLTSIKENKDVLVCGQLLNPARMEKLFRNYFREEADNVKQLKAVREDLSLEQALAQVFTSKQKELFLKKFKGEKMSKTEKEYFSRTVKKKVLALANSSLHDLAKEMLNKF